MAHDLSAWDRDTTLYLFTSLTAGSSHVITATSRIETILKANRIPFTYIDTATDDKAKQLFQRRGQGKKLPLLVREGYVIGDIEEIEEWNEFDELEENIGPIEHTAAPASVLTKPYGAGANTSSLSAGNSASGTPQKPVAPPAAPKAAAMEGGEAATSKSADKGVTSPVGNLAIRQLGVEAAAIAKKRQEEKLKAGEKEVEALEGKGGSTEEGTKDVEGAEAEEKAEEEVSQRGKDGEADLKDDVVAEEKPEEAGVAAQAPAATPQAPGTETKTDDTTDDVAAAEVPTRHTVEAGISDDKEAKGDEREAGSKASRISETEADAADIPKPVLDEALSKANNDEGEPGTSSLPTETTQPPTSAEASSTKVDPDIEPATKNDTEPSAASPLPAASAPIPITKEQLANVPTTTTTSPPPLSANNLDNRTFSPQSQTSSAFGPTADFTPLSPPAAAAPTPGQPSSPSGATSIASPPPSAVAKSPPPTPPVVMMHRGSSVSLASAEEVREVERAEAIAEEDEDEEGNGEVKGEEVAVTDGQADEETTPSSTETQPLEPAGANVSAQDKEEADKETEAADAAGAQESIPPEETAGLETEQQREEDEAPKMGLVLQPDLHGEDAEPDTAATTSTSTTAKASTQEQSPDEQETLQDSTTTNTAADETKTATATATAET